MLDVKTSLYNTLTKKIEEFVPNEKGKVGMYTCGPTVYHFAHIGNLRSYIMEDVLEKYLRYVGYDVKRVMNITDVGHLTSDGDTGEDKMLAGARREHKSVRAIAQETRPQKAGCGRTGDELYPGFYPYDRGPFGKRICLCIRGQCVF